jgi:DNA topoisomerase VI subunit B/5S rRNA maturation endonuclease (ribonuclease M5)
MKNKCDLDMPNNKKEKNVVATPESPELFVTTTRIKENKKGNRKEKNKTAAEEEGQQPRLLERDRSSDYFSVQGLSTQTGCDPQDLDVLMLKELVDNALDACDNEPTVTARFQRSELGFLTLTVEDNGKGLVREDLEKILDFSKFSSTKFHYKLPTRGALGNAMKCVAGLPYALAMECNRDLPRPQISVHSLGYKHLIDLETTKQQPQLLINTQLYGLLHGTKISVNLIPLADNWGHKNEYAKLIASYAIFNPNVTLSLQKADPNSDRLDYPSVCKDFEKFKGTSSIHWYSYTSFKDLVDATVRSIQDDDKDLTLTQFIKQFRGLTSDEKVADIIKEFGKDIKYLSALANQKDLIKKLYETLRFHSNNPSPDVLGEIGKENILKRIKQVFGNVKEIKYKAVKKIGSKKDESCPFVLEIALAVLEREWRLNEFVGLNHSPCLSNPFEGYLVRWLDRDKVSEAQIVRETLGNYGIDETQNIALVIHLICPNIQYESYGKGKIDIACFQSALGKTLTEICRFYPKYKRRGAYEGRGSQANVLLKEELYRRYLLLKKFGQVPQTEKMTRQGIYYKIRSQMHGEIDILRASFIAALSNACKEMGGGDLSIRERLGIIAAERAQLYFRGQVTPISVDRIEDLAAKGSDVILIEKEGVCELLEPFAVRRGIALLNSRGFATDYAKQLLKLSQKWKGNLFLLTDFDASGLLIASKVLEGKIPRIGVDLKMVKKLELSRRDLEEKYDAPKKHLMGLPQEMQAEVKDTRIEIDAVLAAIRPEKFWNYIEQSILEIAPTRDMNRSVDLNIQFPSEIAESINAIKEFIQFLGSEKQGELRQMLSDWNEGFVDVDDKEKEFQSQIVEEIRKNGTVQDLAKQLKCLSAIIPKNS